jgi:hypothetical protein
VLANYSTPVVSNLSVFADKRARAKAQRNEKQNEKAGGNWLWMFWGGSQPAAPLASEKSDW